MSESVICAECSAIIVGPPEKERTPCPQCGSTRRVIDVEIAEEVRLYDSISFKQKMKEIIEAQPDDASYEEIIRELAFERMIDKGLADTRNGRVISDDMMRHRIRSWQK